MWDEFAIEEFDSPVTNISFGPPTYTIQEMRNQDDEVDIPQMRFAVCAQDNFVYELIKPSSGTDSKAMSESNPNEYVKVIVGKHDGLVNDVAWSSNIGLNEDIIGNFMKLSLASAGQDKFVKIWQRAIQKDAWKLKSEINFDHPVNSVSWNEKGTVSVLALGAIVLQVSLSNGESFVYKESIVAEGNWDCLAKINENGDNY